MNHISRQQLFDYVDGILEKNIFRDVDRHLKECPTCREAMEEFRLVERSLMTLPNERVSEEFTHRVMRKLGLSESPSFGWKILKNIAPVLGLTIIIGIAYFVLSFSGAFQSSDVGQSVAATQSMYGKLGQNLNSSISAFNVWMGKYLPFAFAKTSYGMTAFLIGVLLFVGILDHFIFLPMFRRRLPQ